VRIDLERALASLEVSDRETLVIVDVLGFEPREAAAVVGVAAETLRVRLHRARRRFRDEYGDV
jgi:RNA polymerase sigma-70 factor (ECF subfamily)